MEEKKGLPMKTLVIIVAVVVAVAAVSAAVVLVLMQPPPEGAEPLYIVRAEADYFQLPAGSSANVTLWATDRNVPLFGIPVTATFSPEEIGGTLSPEGTVQTNETGLANFIYTAPNRLENVTITFTMTAEIEESEFRSRTDLTVLAVDASPEPFGRVRGVVYDGGTGDAIENATVQVTLAEEFKTGPTNQSGDFEIVDVPVGTASVQVFKSGFKSTGFPTPIEAGKYVRAIFRMEQLVGKVLTVWHTYSGKEQEDFNKMMDRYRATRPDLTVQVEFQPFGGAIDKYITVATAGNAPDVMRFQNDRLGEVARLGFLEPLDRFLDPGLLAKYTTESLETMRIEGQIYALPATQDLLAIVYNKELFDSNGEQYPSDDWDTDDLLRIAQNLTSGGVSGFVQPVTDPFWFFPWQKGYGGHIFSPGASDEDPVTRQVLGFDMEETVNATLWLQDLDKVEGIMFANPGSSTMMSAFLERRAAMVATGPWAIPDMQAAEIEFGIVPFPIVKATGERAQPTLGVKGFGIYKGSNAKEDAFDAIKFIASPEEQINFALGVGGAPGSLAIPTAIQAFTDQRIQDNPIIAQYLKQAQFSQPLPSRPEMGNVWGPITDALAVIYQESPTPAEALQIYEDAEEEIIRAIEG